MNERQTSPEEANKYQTANPIPWASVKPAAAADLLLRRTTMRPTLGCVLGSAFQAVLARSMVVMEVPYSAIPGFATPGVPGHEGRLVFGYLDKTPVVLLGGRLHYYEGHSLAAITFPIRVLAEVGVKDVLLTNAAGGINSRLRPGDFMCLTDHLNFMGLNPLRGSVPAGSQRFVDLTETYSPRLIRLLQRAAKDCDLPLHEGIYLAVSGPSYETPAEIRAFGVLGADAVGMSTVPEAIVARQCGLQVAALSCITNRAAGRGDGTLSHAKVLDASRRAGPRAASLLEAFARLYAQQR